MRQALLNNAEMSLSEAEVAALEDLGDILCEPALGCV